METVCVPSGSVGLPRSIRHWITWDYGDRAGQHSEACKENPTCSQYLSGWAALQLQLWLPSGLRSSGAQMSYDSIGAEAYEVRRAAPSTHAATDKTGKQYASGALHTASILA
eukprot:TRINITY_DN15518_c0_g1_i5.p2 TRINITY_DN15518_c0_g1~~TRINITY_DN15518_c0_g1_i5.p2  ORF type:complete len:112 (-),score=1.15 TRINITY_DN15518_c0_g1_i5:698-1033(-)